MVRLPKSQQPKVQMTIQFLHKFHLSMDFHFFCDIINFSRWTGASRAKRAPLGRRPNGRVRRRFSPFQRVGLKATSRNKTALFAGRRRSSHRSTGASSERFCHLPRFVCTLYMRLAEVSKVYSREMFWSEFHWKISKLFFLNNYFFYIYI
jgi:hypothetical protein